MTGTEHVMKKYVMKQQYTSTQLDVHLARIQSQHRLGLMTHVVMGYPSLEATRERVLAMVEHGVDCIELQIPFSDPLADGPAITRANQTAVANGVSTQDCLDLFAELSQAVDIPFILIGYYNTVLQYGVERFVQVAAQAGCAGFTFPDLPINEYAYEPFYQAAHQAGIPVIQLITPLTSNERLQHIADYADSLVYCVARFGVTGNQTDVSLDMQEYLRRVRQQCVPKYGTLSLAVGFGIRTPEQIQQLHGLTDVVVVGSALLDIPTDQLAHSIQSLCASL